MHSHGRSRHRLHPQAVREDQQAAIGSEERNRQYLENNSRYDTCAILSSCAVEYHRFVGFVANMPENRAKGVATVIKNLGVKFHKGLERGSAACPQHGTYTHLGFTAGVKLVPPDEAESHVSF